MHWRFQRACSLHSLSRLLLAAVVLCCLNPAAAEPVVMNQHHMSLNLSQQMVLLEDPDSALDLEGAKAALAQGRFQPVADAPLQLGYSDSAYWLHFQVHNG